MKQTFSKSSINSPAHQKKIKHAEEKQFKLRRSIYDIDRLSHERGTRSGDYQIREAIKSLNSELDLYDSKIKTCDFENINTDIFKEILLFFEENHLESITLHNKIKILYQTLADQKKTDDDNSKNNKIDTYQRTIDNSFRREIEKDLKSFEKSINILLIPNLDEFINSINDLLLYYSAIEAIQKLSLLAPGIEKEDIRRDLISIIRFYFRIKCKVLKKSLSDAEAVSMVDLLLNEMDMKSRLFNFLKIDQQQFYQIVTNSAREYFKYEKVNAPDNSDKYDKKNQIDESAGSGNQDKINVALEYIRKLSSFDISNSGVSLSGYHNVSFIKGYLFNSPGSGKVLLKDLSDYLKDSLFFIDDWISSELKKNSESYNFLKLLIGTFPSQMSFYQSLETAMYVAGLGNNQKTNIWGDSMHYVSNELALNIINEIESVCVELKDAFIKTILEIETNKQKDFTILAKKINIIYDSFDEARKKIIKELNSIK